MAEDHRVDGRETLPGYTCIGLYVHFVLVPFVYFGVLDGAAFWGEGYDRYPFCMAGIVRISYCQLG